MKTIFKLIERAKKEPYLIIPGIMALLNGLRYKVVFFMLRKKVKIGSGFRVYGKFYISGPGKINIGNNCIIDSKLFKTTSFMTHFPDSLICIGDNVGFNGTSIQISKNLTIGTDCAIADAYITDSKGHLLSADRRLYSQRDIPSSHVIIEENVWISTKSVILDGVTIGKNSVIGACSLVTKNIPPNVFFAGIPAKFIKEIPKTQ